MQKWDKFEAGEQLMKGTVLRGEGIDNRGLVVEILEDVVVEEDMFQILPGAVKILETGEGLLSIYLEHYRLSSAPVKQIIEGLLKDHRIDISNLFLVRFFKVDFESSQEWELVYKFAQFVLGKLRFSDTGLDKDAILRLFAVLTLVAELEQYVPQYDFKKLSKKYGTFDDAPDNDLSFILADSGYAEEFPDKTYHFEKVFQYLAQSMIDQPSRGAISTAVSAQYYFKEANHQCREKTVDILKAVLRKTTLEQGVFVDNDIVNEVIGQFISRQATIGDVCDPCMGIGTTITKVNSRFSKQFPLELWGQEFDRRTFLYAGLHFILLDQPVGQLSFENPLRKRKPRKFDLVCAVPPFGGKELAIDFGKVPAEEAFLIHAVKSLQDYGEAFLIIPTSFLTRRSKIKQYLVQENKIDAIIELPALAKPQTALPLSLIILKGRRYSEHIFMANLSEFDLKPGETSVEYLNFFAALIEAREAYHKWKTTSALHCIFEPLEKKNKGLLLNLKPSSYVFTGKAELDQYLSDSTVIELSELVLTKFTNGKQARRKTNNSRQGKVIHARDLRYAKEQLDFTGPITDSKFYPIREDRILQQGDILVPLHDPSNAKVFRLQQPNTSYTVGASLVALRPDQSKVIPTYLVQELRKPMVGLQIKKSQTGSLIARINMRDLLQLKIPSLPIEEQLAKLEALTKGYKVFDEQELSSAEEATIPYLKNTTPPVVKALKHYVSNRYQAVQATTNLLQHFLLAHEEVSSRLIAEQSELSLGQVIDKLANFQQDVFEITDNIEHLFRLDKTLPVTNGDLRKALGTAAEAYQEGFTVNIKGEGAIMPYSPFCIKMIVENLLSNFAKHGGINDVDNPTAEFTVYRPSDDIVEIIYQNNGRPFPDKFSFEDYLSAEQHAGVNAGVGLGGLLVSKAVEKLNGTIQPITIHGENPQGWNVILVITLKRI